MGKDPRHALGGRGEELVARYIEERGWLILARNWRCHRGEVDIIARRGELVAFVEVRSVTGPSVIPAEETVTWKKRHRLERAASAWLTSAKGLPTEIDLRFDVVAVEFPRDGTRVARIRYYEDAFQPEMALY